VRVHCGQDCRRSTESGDESAYRKEIDGLAKKRASTGCFCEEPRPPKTRLRVQLMPAVRGHPSQALMSVGGCRRPVVRNPRYLSLAPKG
jgi:hypothetical protein